MKALSHIPDHKVVGLGIVDKLGRTSNKKTDLEIITVQLGTRYWSILHRLIRHAITYVEAFVKVLIPAIKLKPKVVHCHDAHFLPLSALVAIFCKSILVYDAHELESERNLISRTLSKIILYSEKIFWNRINLLITVSPSIIEWYMENLGKKRNALILNAPDFVPNDEVSNDDNQYFREKFEIPKQNKIFLYLGILMDGRGVDLYLDVFRDEEVSSHIVFMGYGEGVEKLKKVANKCSNVHYHEAVAHEQVVTISKSADVGLCMIKADSLSDYYCLPNKLFEYAFAGIPVLASDFPEIRKVVEKYQLGQVCGLTVPELKEAVLKIENEGTKKNNTSRDNSVLYPISWQYQAERLVEEYKTIL